MPAGFEIWCPENSLRDLERAVAGMEIDGDGTVRAVTPGKPLPPLGDGVYLWLGTGLLNELKAVGAAKKNASLTASREQAHAIPGSKARVLVSFDPFVTTREAERLPELQWDLQLAARLARTGSLQPEIGEYRYVEDFDDALAAAHTGKIDRLALDLETLGLDPFAPGGRILTVQLAYREGHADVYRVPPDGWIPEPIRAQLRALICSPKIKVTGANLKYDEVWLGVHAAIEGIHQTFDTHLVGSLLDENRSNALETHAKVYTPMGGYDNDFNRRYDKGRMDLVPADDLLTYAGGDVDACLRVTRAQVKLLSADKRLLRFYARVLQPAARVFAKVERRGVFVNRERYVELEAECRAEMARLSADALRLFPRRLLLKYADNLSLTRPALIRDFLFSRMGLRLKPQLLTPDGVKRMEAGEKVDLQKYAATSLEHVQMFAHHDVAGRFAELLAKFSQANKTLSTYIVGFQRHIRADGKFHPQYALGRGATQDDAEGGTVTGRLSAKNPAYQCLRGDAMVLTDRGEIPIVDVVARHERGERFRVLTHTGAWRDVVGVYRNGVRPVFRVTADDGRYVVATENHPFLTPAGWRTVTELRELHQPSCYSLAHGNVEASGGGTRVRGLGSGAAALFAHARALVERASQWLGRAQWLPLLSLVGPKLSGASVGGRGVPACPCTPGCGREAPERRPAGQPRRQSGVGYAEGQRPRHCGHGAQYERGAQPEGQAVMGAGSAGTAVAGRGGEGPGDRSAAGRASVHGQSNQEQFALGRVTVTSEGEAETFDLTIDRCHSFVANGFVVHNTIPKRTAWAKPLRSVYPCPPGHGIVKLDFNQGELRIMACVARDPTMIEAYRTNTDLHSLTAAGTMGLTLEQFMALGDDTREDRRRAAKAINFGLLYGMMPPGLVDYARKSYGVEMSLRQAEEYWDAFFRLYNRLPVYHDAIKAHAHAHGCVRNPLGRVRHLPLINGPDREMRSLAERQAVNSPIQSCLSDMMLLAMVEIDRRWPDLHIFGMTHDSLELYVLLDRLMEQAREIRDVLQNLPLKQFGWEPEVVFVADAEIAVEGTLADVKKVKL